MVGREALSLRIINEDVCAAARGLVDIVDVAMNANVKCFFSCVFETISLIMRYR